MGVGVDTDKLWEKSVLLMSLQSLVIASLKERSTFLDHVKNFLIFRGVQNRSKVFLG